MSTSFKTAVAALGAFATTAFAHGTVSGFVTDGTYNQGFLLDYYYENQNTGSFPEIAAWYAENLDNGFVAPDSYGTSDIICHINSQNAPLTSTVSAGGTVEFQWTTWPHGLGPVLTYVANCNGDCATVDKTELLWVKIDEAGIDIDTQVWAAQDLIDNNSTWVTTVPSTLAPGNYVFRHEIIAVHGSGSENGAQNYPQCMNIEITGSGTDNPEGTLGTELYKADDPGILFNPYTTITEYTIPGPALYTGSGSGSDSGSDDAETTSSIAATSTTELVETSTSSTTIADASTTEASETTSTSAESTEVSETSTEEAATSSPIVTSVTSSAAVVPTSSTVPNSSATSAPPTTLVTRTRSAPATPSATTVPGGSVAQSLYGQCGGNNWTGATTCVDGAVCKKWNEWYSQCISA